MVNIDPFNYQETTNINEHNQMVNKINEIITALNNGTLSLFKVTYNETEYDDITDAVSSGELPIMIYNNRAYVYTYTSASDGHYFMSLAYQSYYAICVKSDDTYITPIQFYIQEKLTSGTNIKTINNNSILGSGNIEIESVPELYEIDDGETTVSDIATALNDGKILYCIHEDRLYMFYTENTVAYILTCINTSNSYKMIINKTTGAYTYTTYNLQNKLVSGTNIKTINNESVLGSGNISISGTRTLTSFSVSSISDLYTLISGLSLGDSIYINYYRITSGSYRFILTACELMKIDSNTYLYAKCGYLQDSDTSYKSGYVYAFMIELDSDDNPIGLSIYSKYSTLDTSTNQISYSSNTQIIDDTNIGSITGYKISYT